MIALGIRYLTGYSVAADLARPRQPEWPPHPGRVFMAMAAAHFDTRGDEREREVLEWLEKAGAPSVSASDDRPRSFVETYVPVNDNLSKKGGTGLRARQPRSFSTTRPDRDSVYLIWNSEIPLDLQEALEKLCEKVTRIGHSSSLVQMWVEKGRADLEANWLPDETAASKQLRVVQAGALRRLEETFNKEAIEQYFSLADAIPRSKGREKARLKEELAAKFPNGCPESVPPVLPNWRGYAKKASREPSTAVVPGPFDEQIIVLTKEDGRVLGLESTLQLTGALRNAAMKVLPQGHSPAWLSGHDSDGSPTAKLHAAFFPLPFVGAKYADGHVMGLALAIPRELPAHEVRTVLGGLLFHPESGEERSIHLWREPLWDWCLRREIRNWPPVTLRRVTWTGPSRVWASVTPVVLHHYPKKNREGDVERIVREAFDSALLPEPERICVGPASHFEGGGHVRAMPEFTEGGQSLCRYQTHVVVEFASPVRGPVLVGRGRFRGYGLFRPVTDQEGGNGHSSR
ncbi:MAG TPA: type I-U CRISPR-associated protein Csb2 [Bryobacteraceae bacterium]|nr:type I-U CRISPR-associated protein Csb2 [Bryobacteraceae bacterium]